MNELINKEKYCARENKHYVMNVVDMHCQCNELFILSVNHILESLQIFDFNYIYLKSHTHNSF